MYTSSESKIFIDSSLSDIYARFTKQASDIDPLFSQLLIEMQNFIRRGGKRQRPYLAYLAYTGMGGSNTEALFPVAAGLEIFHNFLLIHDDIIDRDFIRYGGANLSGVFYAILLKLGCVETEAIHYAESAALLAGDVASSMARSVLYEAPFPAEVKLYALKLLDQALFSVGGGEYVDALATPLIEDSLSYRRILAIYRYKTAEYSFDMPLQIGTALAGVTDIQEKLSAFSIPLGIGFQMRDDYLGLFGETKDTGKPVISDLREGKQTALYALSLEMANQLQRQELELHYGNPEATESDLDVVRQICQATGACEALELEIQRYATKALEALPAINFSNEVTSALKTFVSSNLYRSV